MKAPTTVYGYKVKDLRTLGC